jgi:hypothetical protein
MDDIELPCIDCLAFPMCFARIQSCMCKDTQEQVAVVRIITDKCQPIFTYLFDHPESFKIPEDRALAFVTYFKIIKKDKQ